MLHGLGKLTWVELKIFLREPLGAIGTILIPVVIFIVVGRAVGPKLAPTGLPADSFIGVGLPVLASLFISISAVLSLVTIISIYREGGILKRLRATPLRPQTILSRARNRQTVAYGSDHHVDGGRRGSVISHPACAFRL